MDDQQRELARRGARAERIRARRRLGLEVRLLQWILGQLNQVCKHLVQVVTTWELANGVEKIANEGGKDGGEEGA